MKIDYEQNTPEEMEEPQRRRDIPGRTDMAFSYFTEAAVYIMIGMTGLKTAQYLSNGNAPQGFYFDAISVAIIGIAIASLSRKTRKRRRSRIEELVQDTEHETTQEEKDYERILR